MPMAFALFVRCRIRVRRLGGSRLEMFIFVTMIRLMVVIVMMVLM